MGHSEESGMPESDSATVERIIANTINETARGDPDALAARIVAALAEAGFRIVCASGRDDTALGPHTPAVERLLAILVPGGILYLSWRVTEGADRRDEHGRLYAAFEPERVLRALTANQVLLDEQVGSVSSGKLIRRIVARKQSAEN
jgi:hypothetical protein